MKLQAHASDSGKEKQALNEKQATLKRIKKATLDQRSTLNSVETLFHMNWNKMLEENVERYCTAAANTRASACINKATEDNTTPWRGNCPTSLLSTTAATAPLKA